MVFNADFSRWEGVPLVKTKFGVYQTPFLSRESQLRAADLMREAGVQDMRYEFAWGKPDAFAFDQISGDAKNPTIAFAAFDPFVEKLRDAAITPLFALTYNPVPLKTGTDWQRWKDTPRDLAAYREIVRRYAAHYRDALKIPGALYEVWNEPDIPGDGGKMFFNGTPADYGRLYDVAAPGIQAGDADAQTGGAATAYDLAFIKPILAGFAPLDFASIHAYNNYASQINNLRGLMANRPGLPILVTEYASYDTFGRNAPVSRHPGAMRFFRDVSGLLTFTDTTKIYWAQWVDDDLGMITRDFRRKAIFHAYAIYQTRMPVDRNPITPEGGAGDVRAMASSDDNNAGIVLWNEGTAEKTVEVRLNYLPFARGTGGVYRIDSAHASFTDNPAREDLQEQEKWSFSSGATVWRGRIPGESVIFLSLSDGGGKSLLKENRVGKFVRSHYWFPERGSTAYADFDPRTSIFRLGAGEKENSLAQIGVVLDKSPDKIRVQVRREGVFAVRDAESLFGFRIDFGSDTGYRKSVLLSDETPDKGRKTILPWGKGGAVADASLIRPELKKRMRSGNAFTIDLARLAPSGWNRRLCLTAILQNRGADSRARLQLTPL